MEKSLQILNRQEKITVWSERITAAEVMLNDFHGADRVFLATGFTDLRREIDGLAAIVQQQFELDPFTNTLFLFCGRCRDRFKAHKPVNELEIV